ncbi:MAG TPA: hypothetical protein VLT16_00560 [Candidatus Limnocylindrales bacterium]|nr:hypothetical protein [Candidatus Limnocylindrales bacterium]
MIRWITRSPYSHAAFAFDAHSRGVLAQLEGEGKAGKLSDLAWPNNPMSRLGPFHGPVVEAWQGGVKASPSLATLHTPGTKVDLFRFKHVLTVAEERSLILLLAGDIGDPYSYWNVLKFITRRPGNLDGSWFCSELVFDRCAKIGRRLLERKKAWAVPPDWLQMPTELEYEGQEVTP